ncbi:acetyl/propionyl/methylcrotonyl-CoA carboxylase subunit alpha [Glacieibacterium megasporae]|uniref:acetyl/propionyl/methylcrotonyl-CoA carboxylase subunit alpha n=1 Tax=Glacieibacterium megasporae TaxID=2835787 RepID=UPI001C1E510C|nr:biotin carboxylase N-terminal domain-containing protein [Polymorphobacter megasporae]UAJ09367.1 ATP-grasp domain-containing protein [Polymorphobacter megasporae]
MKKLLIANRGEIARRIIRTAHAMGIETVAVYSDADAGALHVREATQAVHIGPAPAAESYLDSAKLLGAAARSGADAVHPGYGFLSENADFADAVRDAGLIFVGPPAAAMRAMGLKDGAKALMKKAGVPTTPGYQGDDQSLVRLERAAAQIGFPLLIKAVAGGGGKGMRAVDTKAEFAEALLAAQREAGRAFGNDGVLLEKLIARPRHVEVQVFADAAGNVVHLFERDCSLQRRHQKVIEEAPAPGLSDRLRHILGVAACAAATAIDYEGAGTVEFILDLDAVDENGDPAFYFMEMNTRLQVEHPVTEAITGFDLVEWQLRVARGEMLPANQTNIVATGHAVEARLYAEDPDNGFLPSTGVLSRVRFPGTARFVNGGIASPRIDSGVETGSEISVFYDPMIAKVIAYGPDRSRAIDALVAALDGCIIDGVRTNRAFLARLIDHPAFRAAEIDTGFIARHADDLAPPVGVSDDSVVVAALATAPVTPPAPTMFERLGGWRLNLPVPRYVDLFKPDGERVALTVDGDRIEGMAAPLTATGRFLDDIRFEADIGGRLVHAIVIRGEGSIEVRIAGRADTLSLRAPRIAGIEPGGDGRVLAPMPGRVLALDVAVGTAVDAGDRLLVLEAMKMEHRLVAKVAGKVSAVHVAEGDQVGDGMLLVEIEGLAA